MNEACNQASSDEKTCIDSLRIANIQDKCERGFHEAKTKGDENGKKQERRNTLGIGFFLLELGGCKFEEFFGCGKDDSIGKS